VGCILKCKEKGRDMKGAKGIAMEPAPAEVLQRVECRAWERQSCDLPIACQPIASSSSNELSWPAKIRNLSVGGVGLVIERRFEPGVILFLEITPPASGSKETLMARVVHATAQAGNLWLLGCAFCSRLSPGKIQSLVGLGRPSHPVPGGEARPVSAGLTAHGTAEGQASPPSLKTGRDKSPAGLNRRDSAAASPAAEETPRHAFFRKTRNSFLILEGVTLEGTYQEETATLLLARFHLWASWPLPEGTGLFLRVIDPEGNPVGVRIRVAHCCQNGDRWTIHYELVETPSAEALCLLGYSGGVTA
jgi:hypothetical protein